MRKLIPLLVLIVGVVGTAWATDPPTVSAEFTVTTAPNKTGTLYYVKTDYVLDNCRDNTTNNTENPGNVVFVSVWATADCYCGEYTQVGNTVYEDLSVSGSSSSHRTGSMGPALLPLPATDGWYVYVKVQYTNGSIYTMCYTETYWIAKP
jgi:hypothetical protein